MAHPLVVHCKKERYDFYIGRGSVYGNPFTHLPLGNTKAMIQVATRDQSIEAYKIWLEMGGDSTEYMVKLLNDCHLNVIASSQDRFAWDQKRNLILMSVHELHNQILGCYCAPQSCHGEVLVELSKGGTK